MKTNSCRRECHLWHYRKYVPKNLNVFGIQKGVFALVYGRYPSREEANKVFQLLRINDPGLNLKILKF